MKHCGKLWQHAVYRKTRRNFNQDDYLKLAAKYCTRTVSSAGFRTAPLWIIWSTTCCHWAAVPVLETTWARVWHAVQRVSISVFPSATVVVLPPEELDVGTAVVELVEEQAAIRIAQIINIKGMNINFFILLHSVPTVVLLILQQNIGMRTYLDKTIFLARLWQIRLIAALKWV